MTTVSNEYVIDEWPKPKRLPDVVSIPSRSKNEFFYYFMTVDNRIWEMSQAQRETWKNEILNNWDQYHQILYMDGTGAFHQQLKDMNRMGGGIILVAGDMGTGKSEFAMSVTKIWNVLNKNPDPIHIFWSKSEVRSKIRKTSSHTAHIIDEDMKATGSGSANLEIHLQNLFESIRKTGKLILQVGVNAQPSRLGRAVGLQIFPIGFNRRFQANRFIVCNWKGEPLWIAATQRFHRPTERAYFEGVLGYLGEYKDRALEFSNDMTGVFSGSNAEQEKEWGEILIKHCQKKYPGAKLSMEVLEFLAIQIGIPQESIASIRRVCAFTRLSLDQEKISKSVKEAIEITEAGWKGFRKGLYDLSLKNGASERDAEMLSLYYVPREPKWSYADVAKETGVSILSDSVSKMVRRRRKQLRTKELGDLGEKFVMSQLDNMGAEWGGGGDDTADVMIGRFAFNVKVTLSDSIRKFEPTTPEDEFDDSMVILLMPRLLECRIYEITGAHTMLNGRKGRLVAIANLSVILKEMMLVKDDDIPKGGD